MSLPREWIVPDWPAPSRVRAFVTTRHGGVSSGEFASMNLGSRSGDEAANVDRNRGILRAHLPADPQWMAQVHGTDVADLDRLPLSEAPRADAAVASAPHRVGVVSTADCMPLFLAAADGSRVAVAHAGWRGMAAGVIENTVRAMGTDPAGVLAWMGPTIGPTVFEVGPEVRAAFLAADPDADSAFNPHVPGKYLADLYALARRRLARAGVHAVHGGGFCTYSDTERFFSYRRAQRSGRMGAFIWID
jgi:purine-nucleoside/S-methyl-5'-thioadenosine phosphorylase / adenosine deaminase